MLGLVVEAGMMELEVISWRPVRLWWALFWRWALIYLGITGAALLVLTTFALMFMNKSHLPPASVAHLIVRPLVALWLISLPLAGLMATRLAVGSRIGQFRIALLPIDPSAKLSADAEPALTP